MQIKVIPAIPLRDFYNKHLEGIRGMNIGKHFDYINTFQIASTKMTKTDRLILKELEIGDVFTFDISINILSSIDRNEGSNTCREIPDIKNCLYSNLRKYRDNDCIDRIVTTALQNADRYSFNYNAPRTFRELKALVNKMSEDNLSEATADMYTQGIKLLSATEANVNTIEGDLMRNIGMSFCLYGINKMCTLWLSINGRI